MALASTCERSTGSPWRKRFYLIWTGQAISILGSRLVQFALIWHLTVETGSARVLATAALVGMLPGVVLGPFVGTLLDRWNRRRMMILADGCTAFTTLALAVWFFLGSPGGSPGTEVIYAVMFVRALADSIHTNAMSASTVMMVPAVRLSRVQGLNQVLNGGLNILAAPMGALLLSLTAVEYILLIDVVTALIAIGPLLFVTIPQPSMKRSDSRFSVLHDFREGLRYIYRRRGLFIISLMTVGINLTIIPAFSLLPLLVKDHFAGGAVQLGMIESALGIGILAGGGILSLWGGFRRRIVTALLGLMGMGLGALMVAAAPPALFVLAVAGVLTVGFMNSLTMGPFIAVIQATVPAEMQARVLSLLSSIGAGMAPLGLAVAGPVSDVMGVQPWFLAGGVICLFMGFGGLLIPSVMTLETPDAVDAEGTLIQTH